MDNQRGEIILGVMIVIMTAMMLFGGMHLLHRGHPCGVDQPRNEAKRDRLNEGSQHVRSRVGAQAIVPAWEDAR